MCRKKVVITARWWWLSWSREKHVFNVTVGAEDPRHDTLRIEARKLKDGRRQRGAGNV